jgi:hypothetical protein
VSIDGETQDSGKGTASVLTTKGAREREKWRGLLEEEKEKDPKVGDERRASEEASDWEPDWS